MQVRLLSPGMEGRKWAQFLSGGRLWKASQPGVRTSSCLLCTLFLIPPRPARENQSWGQSRRDWDSPPYQSVPAGTAQTEQRGSSIRHSLLQAQQMGLLCRSGGVTRPRAWCAGRHIAPSQHLTPTRPLHPFTLILQLIPVPSPDSWSSCSPIQGRAGCWDGARFSERRPFKVALSLPLTCPLLRCPS